MSSPAVTDPDLGVPAATCVYTYRVSQSVAGGPSQGWRRAFREKVESRGFVMAGECLVVESGGVYWVRGWVRPA